MEPLGGKRRINGGGGTGNLSEDNKQTLRVCSRGRTTPREGSQEHWEASGTAAGNRKSWREKDPPGLGIQEQKKKKKKNARRRELADQKEVKNAGGTAPKIHMPDRVFKP